MRYLSVLSCLLFLLTPLRAQVNINTNAVEKAVVFLYASKESGDLAVIPISVFATAEELHTLAVGSSIVSAGLIPGASGKKRNHPIFKFGYLSSIPDEPIDAGCD